MASLNNVNWGFNPTGTGLGGESSPSMPGDADLGLANPENVLAARMRDFDAQMARQYSTEAVLDAEWSSGSRRTNAPDAVGNSAVMSGGEPVPADFAVRTRVRRAALEDPNNGMSAEGAASLADSLEQYDSRTLEGFHLPTQVEPVVSNEVGLVTGDGGLPSAFVDYNTGEIADSLRSTLRSVIEAGTPAQQVVDNFGYVHKHAPGTGFYDAPGKSRPGGLAGIKQRLGSMIKPPPATRASQPLLALASTNPAVLRSLGIKDLSANGGTDYAAGAQNDPYNQGGIPPSSDGASFGTNPATGTGGAAREATGSPAVNTNIMGDADESATGGGAPIIDSSGAAAYNSGSSRSSDAPSLFSDEYAGESVDDDVSKTKVRFPWLILLGVGVAAAGIGIAVKGQG
jgi:hypothetical protein